MTIGSLAGKLSGNPAFWSDWSDRYRRSSKSSSLRITGRRNTNSVVWALVFEMLLNRGPMPGMSPRRGIFETDSSTSFRVRPPMMMALPLGIVTTLLTVSVCRGGGTPADPSPVKLLSVTE